MNNIKAFAELWREKVTTYAWLNLCQRPEDEDDEQEVGEFIYELYRDEKHLFKTEGCTLDIKSCEKSYKSPWFKQTAGFEINGEKYIIGWHGGLDANAIMIGRL